VLLVAGWRNTTIVVPSFAAVRAQYVPSEAYLVDRHGEVLEASRRNLGVRRFDWVALDGTSPALKTAVIEAEDRQFYEHHGIDWWAALAAIKAQLIDHRRRGASTITMQLASLIHGDRGGGSRQQQWRRKIAQVCIARSLEFTFAKTGTSKDMRDNWCIGFSRDFTVAVWVGNFEGDAMHDVSGVTGAAPVWHDIMLALHRELATAAPKPPLGIVATAIRFIPAVEPPRLEWYLAGTQTDRVVGLSATAKIAHIVSPANGMIIALDPDIPARSQRIPLTAQGAPAGMIVRLNDTVLGSATQKILWAPVAGTQHLTLEDRAGRTVDRILFTVR